jgi:hypothetical protein
MEHAPFQSPFREPLDGVYVRATLPTTEATRTTKMIVVVWAIVALVAISIAITVEESFSPFAQNQARYHPSITSAILAVAMILLRRFEVPEQLWVNRATVFILNSLCATQAVADAAATRRCARRLAACARIRLGFRNRTPALRHFR